MKTSLSLLLMMAGVVAAGAQPPAVPAEPPLSPADLDRLAGPIALYPDPLVAIILPSAAASSDIVVADRYVSAAGSGAQIDAQGWDPSVEALAHYPSLLSWLDSNLQYTEALGAAFVNDNAGLMQAIQRMRQQAMADGMLTNTPQQVVFTKDGEIVIEPAQVDQIYLPDYDPSLLYGPAAFYGPEYVSFSPACAAGPWLDVGCDWVGGAVWFGSAHRPWIWERRGNERNEPRPAIHHRWEGSPTVARGNFSPPSARPRFAGQPRQHWESPQTGYRPAARQGAYQPRAAAPASRSYAPRSEAPAYHSAPAPASESRSAPASSNGRNDNKR